MPDNLYADLAWLAPAPEDFKAQVRNLASAGQGTGSIARRLATHALDFEQLRRLGAVLDRLEADGVSLAPLQPFRLAVVSNATTDLLVSAFRASAARHSIDLRLHVADYGQAHQAILDPTSDLHGFSPDAVLIALDYRGLQLKPRLGRADVAREMIDNALNTIRRMRTAVHTHSKARCIVQTLARPPESLVGSLDYVLPGTMRTLVESVNRGLADELSSRDVLLDVANIAETVGLAEWHDPELWNLGKIPFGLRYVPLYADHLTRLLAATLGGSGKVLALDLDNTLWGGVIGDDGMDGINIAQGDATGEAHLELQQTALDLRSRGVVLAVSSKNDDDKARQPFREHAEMRLREEHLAVIRANWDDKASNLEAIAQQLDLGIDSVVFVDDNPMERDLVRRLAPAVRVPEMPDQPALFSRILLAAGYFETIALTDEDLVRAELYQKSSARNQLHHSANDIESYLESLQMTILFRPFDAIGRKRITQLINKSNQFNLTTRRYTEAEVEQFENDPSSYTLQVRLTDTFGDNGMITVVIARAHGAAWEIDTWLMSCRVLKRRVEEAVLDRLVGAAKAAGVRSIVGVYRPSSKNGIVAMHYKNLGFSLIVRSDDGEEIWKLNVEDYTSPTLPMIVD